MIARVLPHERTAITTGASIRVNCVRKISLGKVRRWRTGDWRRTPPLSRCSVRISQVRIAAFRCRLRTRDAADSAPVRIQRGFTSDSLRLCFGRRATWRHLPVLESPSMRKPTTSAFGFLIPRTALALCCAAAATCLAFFSFAAEQTSTAKSPNALAASEVTPPRYQVHIPPPGLGASAGEPSIGIGKPIEGHPEGRTMYIASLQTLRITFDDCASPAADLWEDVTFPTTGAVSLDPILFTDPQTGRTFASQLLGKASSMAYSDTDGGANGEDWMQSQGSGINSGVDHQTIGGGPFAPPLTRDPNGPLYPNAVYYASQDGAVAQAAVSLDGGQTFGPAVPMYTLAQCAGIHGHIKVAPDGTVYVPNKGCGAEQAAVVSENNGATWEVRKVPGSTAVTGIIDPAVGIGTNNTVYFGGKGADGLPFTAVSKDRGKTWTNFQKLGVDLGIQNATFPQMTAGDDDRAAMTFLGTVTGGNYQAHISTPGGAGFKGEWHLYIATTYDSGVTWTVVNATPGDPVQRNSICNGGTVCINTPDDRNLLDFNDVQIDREGRVLAAFADGCISANCIAGVDANGDGFKDNDYTSRATLARQSGGKGLLAAFDSPEAEPNPPAAPRVTGATRDADDIVRIRWLAPDNGGSPITGYKVFRKAGANGFAALLASVPADQFVVEDSTTVAGAEYFYSVVATNAEGDSVSCGEFAISLPPASETPCELPGITILNDPAGDLITPTGQVTYPGYDLRSVSIAEPGTFADQLVFTIKVESLATVPPNTRWPLQFRVPGDEGNVGRWVEMMSDAAGQVSFRHGTFAITNGAYGAPNTVGGPADEGSGYTPDGTIRIVVARAKIGDPAVGAALNGFLIRVRAVAVTPDNMPSSLAPEGLYIVTGNAFCKPNTAPLAALTATPQSGQAPLQVTLDASASSDSDTDPKDTIASYRFNFGDGSPDAVQSTPTVQHTYEGGGGYRATVRVIDSRNKVSDNTAGVTIEVGGPAVSPTPGPVNAAKLLNLATRARVQTNDNVLIGGFIITGLDPKMMIVRAIGPSIQANGAPFEGRLEDPTLELYDDNGVLVTSNDNWKESEFRAEIEASGLAPSDDRESAIARIVPPGAYTAVVRGKNDTTGIGLVEVYDRNAGADSRLANLSTRGGVDSGDNVLIGGVTLGDQPGATRVVLRAIAPSLKGQIPAALNDPILQLLDANGSPIAENDNWHDTAGRADIESNGLAPSSDAESALLMNFTPGQYTAIVRSKDGTAGLALVEAYNLP